MGERHKIFEEEGVKYKKCNVCLNVLTIDKYAKESKKKSGIRGDCKECQYQTRLRAFKHRVDTTKEAQVIVSFSGGKDSTAMLLRMIELGERIDHIVFADTTYEFPFLYEYIKKIEKHIGRKITVVKPKKSLDEWRFGKYTRGASEGKVRGLPTVINPCYWMREAKFLPLKNFYKQFDNYTNVIGIAFDEQDRVQVDPTIRYPLIEWEWTEDDCVNYLLKKGLVNDLYKQFSRLGCWMCPKQSVYSKYMLWKHYPELWKLVKVMEQENLRDVNKTIFMEPLSYYENRFSNGYIPKDNSSVCFECKGIRSAYTQMSNPDSELWDDMYK